MKSSLILFIAIALPFVSSAQSEELFKVWTDSTIARANSAEGVSYMNEEEQKVVFYTNLVRMNPPLFAETYLKDYLKEKGIRKDKDVKGLIEQLEKAGQKAVLEPSEPLTKAARSHATDMGQTGRTGHNASDGTSYAQRMDEVSKMYAGINENANYGNDQAMDILVDLLIDRDVPSAGHRNNILDSEMRFIGVAIEPHKRFGTNCVQDFGGSLLK